VLQVADIRNDESYIKGFRPIVNLADNGGARTLLMVPMLKERELMGAIAIFRQEVKPFTDKQIELVTNFAAQAVIAIENTRLLNELRESLQQQTATSEVLRVISSSPGELEPVFTAMLANATRICEATFGTLALYESDDFRIVALHGVPAAFSEARLRQPMIHPGPGHHLTRLVQTKQLVHIADLSADQAAAPALAKLAGARTLLTVPMLKDNELIGAIAIYRQEVRHFIEKQIELVQNFASQAVIAIENARLLNELRQRTSDLSEALEQQTATSEVLKVISSSPGDLKPVFEAILENATRICEAQFGNLHSYDGSLFHLVATRNAPQALLEFQRQRGPFQPRPGSSLDRLLKTGDVVHLADEAVEPSAPARLAGAKTLLSVPMFKDEALVGAIVIYRQEVRPFSGKQIELMKNFAAQAVIAIENTRLLNELRESLQQQTATADVLKVISRSTFDLQTVLDTLTGSAVRLCEADAAMIFRPNGAAYHLAASSGLDVRHREHLQSLAIAPGRGTVAGRVLLERAPVHLHDAQADPEFTLGAALRTRTILGVPLLREGIPIGVIVLTRRTVRPFTDKQIELVSTFADQAVIAIENVRLFDEIQDKSRQLAEASQHKSQFLANMSHELRTPLNAILGYTELILDSVYGDMPEKARSVLDRVQRNGRHLLGLINDVLDLSKIEAGQLILALGDYSLKNVVHTVFSAVEPLANEKKLAFKIDVPPDMPSGHGDERRLTQVLLNLVGNAIKFTDVGEVVIKASKVNGLFQLTVSDTGPGISETDQAKLFQEFQQADNSVTRKKGGTGLGLAISKR
jgi:signal transduction histidine kinase